MGVEMKYAIDLIIRFEVSNMKMNIWLIREKIWSLGFLKIKEKTIFCQLSQKKFWMNRLKSVDFSIYGCMLTAKNMISLHKGHHQNKIGSE